MVWYIVHVKSFCCILWQISGEMGRFAEVREWPCDLVDVNAIVKTEPVKVMNIIHTVVSIVRLTEMGVVMEPSTMIRYAFDTGGGDISTDEENILIGFSTQEKHGQLMFIRSDSQPIEYMSIEINNNGNPHNK